MTILINTDICNKVECKNYIEIKGHCKLILPECNRINNYSHMGYNHIGCIIPDKCEYKNLHVINKMNLDFLGLRGCSGCKYNPKESE